MRRANAIDHHHMVGHPHMAVTARIARSPAIELDGDRDRTAHPVHLGAQGRVYSDIRRKIDPDGIAISIRSVRHGLRSAAHTSELQSLMRISYAVFCLNKKNNKTIKHIHRLVIRTEINTS